MRSNNTNEPITHLAMPQRRFPVLIDSAREKAEGFVASTSWSDKDVTWVRRLEPSFVDGLKTPQKRREIEKEYGIIGETEWNRLREMLALIDRLNAGDWSPIIATNAREVLDQALPTALLDSLSPEGWFLDDKSGTGTMTFRSASPDRRSAVSIEIGKIKRHELGKVRKAAPSVNSHTELDGTPVISAKFSGSYRTAAFALSEAFTAGLSKTRFVVWWHGTAKRFVPGLYCPDILTALYALAMWSSGTAGGWAICQKCGNDFPRSRAKQLYCSHKCQVAAAMKRYRGNLEQKAKAKTTAASKKRKERK